MEKKITKRSKPKFLRTDSHKMIKLGKGVRKNQKWHKAIGRHNKIRLSRKGHSQRPKVGWGSPKGIRDLVLGIRSVRVENVKDLEKVGKRDGIVIGRVGKKKQREIIAKANEMKIKILNRYRRTPLDTKDQTGQGGKK